MFGCLSAAGFETTSEALYLGKKLLVIPIRNQYEQLCNAAALEELGGSVIYNIESDFTSKLSDWIKEGTVMTLPEVCEENALAEKIIKAGLEAVETYQDIDRF